MKSNKISGERLSLAPRTDDTSGSGAQFYRTQPKLPWSLPPHPASG